MEKINEYIDHTMLKAYAKEEDIIKLCNEATQYGFKSVCVNPYYVEFVKNYLTKINSKVKICTVIGFPLGQNTTKTKIFETQDALENGAEEIDMVINIAALLDKKYEYVKNEIEEIRKVTQNNILKVIIETCYLEDEDIKIMTKICSELQVDYIKTSTGFGKRGASENDVFLMNKHRSNNLQIKASGGISDYDTAKKMVELGATRLGTSKSIQICEK